RKKPSKLFQSWRLLRRHRRHRQDFAGRQQMKQWTKPTRSQVEAAMGRLIQAGQVQYFFDKLENPEWVEPLFEKGFFKNPPAPVSNEVEQTISFPIWPESR